MSEGSQVERALDRHVAALNVAHEKASASAPPFDDSEILDLNGWWRSVFRCSWKSLVKCIQTVSRATY